MPPTPSAPPSAPGLASTEAARRLAADGTNALPEDQGRGLWAIIGEVLREPMFLLLIAAGTIYLLLGSTGDALLLLGFVFLIMGLTVFQARRTERALDALRDLASPQALVLRDGKRQRIPAEQLVRGDLMVLAEGDRIPADGVLRTGARLSVDESLLTGEAVPVDKTASTSVTTMEPPGGNDLASVFSGTLVTAGQGTAEILATGSRSELGRIGAALLAVQPERTRLQLETGRMVRILALIALGLSAAVTVIFALTRGGTGADWIQGLLAGITMAMGILPEELPMILTIFLALGAWRISRHRVLTRRMPAIENLGATTVLCTDKTGTLTRNQMVVSRVVVDDREWDLEQPGNPPADVTDLLQVAQRASRPDPYDPMERAIHAAGRPGSDKKSPPGEPGWHLEREYPLASDLLAMTQVWRHDGDQGLLLAAKGAPEAIADLCGLAPQQRDALGRKATALAALGLRVLAVARGHVAASGDLPESAHDLDLDLVGLLALSDPIRSNVPGAVAECRAAGIRVVMITGDYPATAQSIARQAGLANPDEFLSGTDLDQLSDADLIRRIPTVHIFARVVPTQKLRIVQALKANHDVVAMTGDGVNDAPALKAADIGIAMGGRGTDVARESADLVLLDDDFTAIVAAVRLGRRIFDNLKKAVAFTVAVHVPIAGLSILPVFFPSWPLLLMPIHIVFLEMVINPACALIFEAEPEEQDVMARPPRDSQERLFAWPSLGLSLLQGASVLAVCVGIYLYARTGHGVDAARAMTFTALVGAILAIIVTNRSWTRSLVDIVKIPNPAQWWVVMGAGGFLGLVLSVPKARDLFHFAPLDGDDLCLSLAAGLLCGIWLEILKWLRRQHRPATL